jgi:hypothetical protein
MGEAGSNGAIGARTWAIAEGYIPSASTGEGPALESHEAACMQHTRLDSRQPPLALLSTVAHPA